MHVNMSFAKKPELPETEHNMEVRATLTWSASLLVQLGPSENAPGVRRPLVSLPPTIGGLKVLEGYDQVVAVSIVRATEEGLRWEEVHHICRWEMLELAGDGQYLNLLMCKSGAAFVVDLDGLEQIDECTRKWFPMGTFTSARQLQNAYVVEGLVAGRRDDVDVVNVWSIEARGVHCAIARETIGVNVETLREGDRVRCMVSHHERVLSASVLGVGRSTSTC